MKRITLFAMLAVVFYSCGTYNYYPHPVNSGFYANQGEVQVSGYMGIAGFSSTGGVAITKNVSLMGMYAGNPGTGDYHSKEGEVSAGLNNGRKDNPLMYGISAGYGFGNNFKQDSGAAYKSFNGHFDRPFVVMSLGTASIRSKGFRADASVSVRVNYLLYKGSETYNTGEMYPFQSDHFYYEPYLRGSIGGRHVRFDLATGFAFKNLTEARKGVKIFPMHLNIGMSLIFGRKYEVAKEK